MKEIGKVGLLVLVVISPSTQAVEEPLVPIEFVTGAPPAQISDHSLLNIPEAGPAPGKAPRQAQAQVVEPAQIPLPAVSMAMMRKVREMEQKVRELDEQQASRDAETTVTAIPGVNQIINISRGHLNRIVTPFADPVVRTNSPAEITTRANVLYIAAEGDAPQPLFVFQKGQEDFALSLTLVPRAIPPRDIQLHTEGQPVARPVRNRLASVSYREEPYVRGLVDIMTTLAAEEVPPGLNLRMPIPTDPKMDCEGDTNGHSFEIRPGQVLEGVDYLVMVGEVRNTAQEAREIEEAECYYEGVAAVAAWPSPKLTAGRSAELFIIFNRLPLDKARAKPSRPSLVKGRDTLGHE